MPSAPHARHRRFVDRFSVLADVAESLRRPEPPDALGGAVRDVPQAGCSRRLNRVNLTFVASGPGPESLSHLRGLGLRAAKNLPGRRELAHGEGSAKYAPDVIRAAPSEP
jgi:hypothetical protein